MMVERIDVPTAQRLLAGEGYAYLDVRSEAEFALGHPTGAFNIPLYHGPDEGAAENTGFMAVVRRSFAADQKLVVGCRCGIASLAAARRLAHAGYTVLELRPGFSGRKDPFGRVVEAGWQALGLPCSMDPLPGRDYAALSGDRAAQDR